MTNQSTRVWININTGEWGHGNSREVIVEFPSLRELDVFAHFTPDQHAVFTGQLRDAMGEWRILADATTDVVTTKVDFQIPAPPGTDDTVEMVVLPGPILKFSGIWVMTDSQGRLIHQHLAGGRDPRTQVELTLCGLCLPTGAQPAPSGAPVCERCQSLNT